MRRGMLIVIDGIDGSGKSVQTQMLCDRLKEEGHTVVMPNFPRYEKESSYFVRAMLQGEYQKMGGVNPHVASMFYGFDRMDAAHEMMQQLEAGNILVSNRYTSSNVGHQGGRFKDSKERKAYYAWLDHFEYEQLRIPRPDLVLYLHVPVEVSLTLIHNRFLKSGQLQKDLHEGDVDHLEKAYNSYREAATLFPYWRTIECMKDNQLMSPEAIHEVIWKTIDPVMQEYAQSSQQVSAL